MKGGMVMIRKTAVTIIGTKDIQTEIFEQIKPYLYEPELKNMSVPDFGNLRLILEDQTGVDLFMRICDEKGLHPRVTQWVKYTAAEKKKVEYYSMHVSDPLELEGTNAASYGTQYEGRCEYCGLGGRLAGDVLVDRKFVRKHKIGCLYPDIYVSAEIKAIIEGEGLTGVSFEHRVRDYKGRELPELYVMSIHNVLPPMSDATWLIEDVDPWNKECGHHTLFLHSDVQYEREKLSGAKDFNLSKEYVNNYRMQEIIVSARVREVFKKHKIYAGFFPVALL